MTRSKWPLDYIYVEKRKKKENGDRRQQGFQPRHEKIIKLFNLHARFVPILPLLLYLIWHEKNSIKCKKKCAQQRKFRKTIKIHLTS